MAKIIVMFTESLPEREETVHRSYNITHYTRSL